MRRDQPAVVLVAVAIVIVGAVRGAAQVDPPHRPPAPMAEAGAPERMDLQAKVQGLDLFGPVSATWSADDGVRMQAARVANSSSTASPTLYLRMWASEQRPVAGSTVFAWTFGTYTLGVLAAGSQVQNVDTGYVSYVPPPAGCYYVSMALQTLSGSTYTYWSFITFTYGGTPDGQGYSRFAFGGASCSGSTAAAAGVLYAVENDDASTLYRIDDYTTSPHATDIGPTGLYSPAIAIDPTTQLLYGFDDRTHDLYRIDASTGSATSIGDSGLSSPSLVALAARADGTLFAWDAFNTNLYRLDKASGHATLVGYTGYHAGGDLVFAADGTLYGSTGSTLVRIDPVTASASAVGSFGVSSVFGLAVAADGTLLAGRDTSSILDSSRLYRVDRNTGAATPIGGALSRSLGDLALLSVGAILPDADFTWSPFQPTAGQQVQFTDQSTGAPTSWHWNLDGQVGDDSTAQNPAWTYNLAGGHEVTLRACNAAGCTTAVQTVTVSQQASLRIDGPASGLTLDPLTFEAKATGCIPNPFGWTWTTDAELEFDRGAIGALFNGTIARGWTTTGTHTVSVRNNNCPGAVGTLSVQLARPGGQETWVTRRLNANPKQHPTVVFCHGWQKKGFDATCKKPNGTVSCGGTLWSCIDKCDGNEVSFSTGALLAGDTDLNQIQFIWDGAGQIPALTLPSAVDYMPAWNRVDDAARHLATSLLTTLGKDYSQPIQFVGHSLGSVVCAQAAVEFLREAHGVTSVQVTALDRPDHVHKLVGSGQFQKFEDLFGFDESYFPALLQRAVRSGLDLRFDNYWA
ncbi:MAG TPA: PKD domain-containing protein, partial [Thermoanaerobaculia bacterium]|nr:PKD domain-containing protein [Thermoanaerobaculia bacterium]